MIENTNLLRFLVFFFLFDLHLHENQNKETMREKNKGETNKKVSK